MTTGMGQRQQGAALIVGLLLLLVLTVIAVVAANSTIQQERMASNLRDASLAFQAAEAANRWGESWLQQRTVADRPWPCLNPACNRGNQVYRPNALPRNKAGQAKGWWKVHGVTFGKNQKTGNNVPGFNGPFVVKNEPEYIIEEVGRLPDDPGVTGAPTEVVFYRVTARGDGSRDLNESAATVESTVAKRY